MSNFDLMLFGLAAFGLYKWSQSQAGSNITPAAATGAAGATSLFGLNPSNYD